MAPNSLATPKTLSARPSWRWPACSAKTIRDGRLTQLFTAQILPQLIRRGYPPCARGDVRGVSLEKLLRFLDPLGTGCPRVHLARRRPVGMASSRCLSGIREPLSTPLQVLSCVWCKPLRWIAVGAKRKITEAEPITLSGRFWSGDGVWNGSAKPNKMVRWTILSDKRREHQRAAGPAVPRAQSDPSERLERVMGIEPTYAAWEADRSHH